ncbi:MAG: ParB/RepB/Spo0J family partition protein [Caulobacteraceae bacterium]|nr:ParB/RepB/Spo0J family partition protein [Caulobacteraceae bacterium]
MSETEHRRGLGRGLSALLGEIDPPRSPAADPPGRRETPIELIKANPDQPRRRFVDADMDELVASIQEKGVLQPILVRPDPAGGPGFEIVAGERRWRAAQRAGLLSLPTVIRELTDQQVLEIGIVENVQRADLSPLEEAMGYRALMERFGRTQEAIAQTVGKSRSHVANTMRLLSLPEAVQAHLAEGRLTAGHARAIATAPDPAALAQDVVARGLSVRQAEALARRGPPAAKPSKPSAPVNKDTDTRALEEDLAEVLGLKVDIIDRGGRGELRLEYETLEQLDDLCRRLTQVPR